MFCSQNEDTNVFMFDYSFIFYQGELTGDLINRSQVHFFFLISLVKVPPSFGISFVYADFPGHEACWDKRDSLESGTVPSGNIREDNWCASTLMGHR